MVWEQAVQKLHIIYRQPEILANNMKFLVVCLTTKFGTLLFQEIQWCKLLLILTVIVSVQTKIM